MKALTLVLVFVPALAFGQSQVEVRRLFESGRFLEVVDTAKPDSEPAVLYVLAQSQQKLGATEDARRVYADLAGRPEGDPWHFIGLSGQRLLDNDVDGALDAARRSTEMAGGLPEAHYQLGMVLAKQQQWPAAAAEFDRVAELQPDNAYAQYNGGLMYYRANRPDRMAIRFEQFLKLAPEAPERPEVLQIMRTVRGR